MLGAFPEHFPNSTSLPAMTTPTTADYAASYIRQFGMALVPLPPRTKRPLADDWGNNVLTDPDAARAYYEKHPDWNIGAALGPSRLCSLDVDDIDATRLIFDEFGWDLDALRDTHPTIQGRPDGFRVMFSVPADTVLPYHALTWPKQDGTKGRFTVFEIRAAVEQQRQDVLPPSIHPDTQQPYVWLTRPVPATGMPPPPDFLLRIWENWDALKPQFQAVCPWAPANTRPAPPPRRANTPTGQASVIDAYNAATDIEHALRSYGYTQHGRRWLSPHSQTKLPGVTVIDGGKCFIHHASDPLCTDESGQPVDSFDLYAEYEHRGDKRDAMRAAAEQLGMKRAPPARPALPAPQEQIDPDTGEITAANDNTPASAGDPSYVDWYSPFPDINGKGKPLATIENVAEARRRLGVTIRYNVIRKDTEILIPGGEFTVDNRANASLAWFASACVRFGIPTGPLGDYVGYLADLNLYNPVAQWITSKPWDGVTRLPALYATITAEDEPLKEVLLKRWLISAIAGAFNPNGVSAHGVLVLQGDQYLGKTKWFKSLVPAELGVIADGLMLRPDDKDNVKLVVSNWLVELGELDATFRKSDIAQLKSFLTRDRDVLRRAYAKLESEYARRTVFFASVNPREFLHDATGNRRYWTIEAKWIDHSHSVDMQQMWAEVHTLYRAGESHYLLPEEMAMLNNSNDDFTVIDPVQDRINTKLDWAADTTRWQWKSATDILMDVGIEKPTQSDATRAAAFIRQKNGNQGRRTANGRVLLAPPRVFA